MLTEIHLIKIITFFAFGYLIGVQNAYQLHDKITPIAISLDNVLHPPSRTLSPVLFSNWLAQLASHYEKAMQ
jgi:hypothetical protein